MTGDDEPDRINIAGFLRGKNAGRITGQHKLLSSSFNLRHGSLNWRSSPWIKS